MTLKKYFWRKIEHFRDRKFSKNRRKFQLKSNFFDFSIFGFFEIFRDFSRFFKNSDFFLIFFKNIFSKASQKISTLSIFKILVPGESRDHQLSRAPKIIQFDWFITEKSREKSTLARNPPKSLFFPGSSVEIPDFRLVPDISTRMGPEAGIHNAPRVLDPGH